MSHFYLKSKKKNISKYTYFLYNYSMKKIAVITGASSGMGKEFSIQVAHNYNFDEIWIIARRKEQLEQLSEQINQTKNFAVLRPIPMDISGKTGVEKFKSLLQEEDAKLKKVESGIEIGLLINNAGFGTYGPFEESSVNREMDMIELNCVTLTGFCGVCMPYLKKDSLIINTASLAAFMPLGNFAVYAATKAYVLSFSVALASELKDKGIKVCALCPGSVSTEFANVASNGARKEVKGGRNPVKVVKHCLKKAYKDKKITLCYPKWKATAFFSRFVGRFLVARYTFKYNPRPHNMDKDLINTSDEVSLDEFL